MADGQTTNPIPRKNKKIVVFSNWLSFRRWKLIPIGYQFFQTCFFFFLIEIIKTLSDLQCCKCNLSLPTPFLLSFLLRLFAVFLY